MREIKFRAWDKLTVRMVKVNRIDFDEKEIDVVIRKDSTSEDYESMGFDEIELMQYTGLKDKNSNEIYEGDIVTFHNQLTDLSSPITKVLKYINGCFGFNDCYEFKIFVPLKGLTSFYSVEVIGNIYENPELLEEVDK